MDLGADKMVECLWRHTDHVGRQLVELVGQTVIGRNGRWSPGHKAYVLIIPRGWWTRGRRVETEVMVSHPLGVGGTGDKIFMRERLGHGGIVTLPHLLPAPFISSDQNPHT